MGSTAAWHGGRVRDAKRDAALGQAVLKLAEHGVRAGGERGAFIVHSQQIAQPAGNYQRDALELAGVETRRRVRVDGVAVADGHLLRGVLRDALRGVRQRGIG